MEWKDIQFYESNLKKPVIIQTNPNKHYLLLRWVVCINLFLNTLWKLPFTITNITEILMFDMHVALY
jgi:hypothetical protein